MFKLKNLLFGFCIFGCQYPVKNDPTFPPEGTELKISFDKGSQSIGYINYNGGKIINSATTVYPIYYGNWDKSNTPYILEDLIKNFGHSSYHNTNTVFYQIDKYNNKTYVSDEINLGKSFYVGYPLGKDLIEPNVGDTVKIIFSEYNLKPDTNGLYILFTSQDVDMSSFCNYSCGFHGYINIDGIFVKYIFTGSSDRCPNDCSVKDKYIEAGYVNSPNNNWEADGMASVLVHEISESMTDPFLDAWWNLSTKEENSDICAWTYGKLYATANNSVANTKIGNRHYLIQQNFKLEDKNGHGHCDLQ